MVNQPYKHQQYFCQVHVPYFVSNTSRSVEVYNKKLIPSVHRIPSLQRVTANAFHREHMDGGCHNRASSRSSSLCSAFCFCFYLPRLWIAESPGLWTLTGTTSGSASRRLPSCSAQRRSAAPGRCASLPQTCKIDGEHVFPMCLPISANMGVEGLAARPR